MKVIWFVNYGQDSSHLWETKIFYKKKEIKSFINGLGSNAYGCKMAFKIDRMEFKK